MFDPRYVLCEKDEPMLEVNRNNYYHSNTQQIFTALVSDFSSHRMLCKQDIKENKNTRIKLDYFMKIWERYYSILFLQLLCFIDSNIIRGLQANSESQQEAYYKIFPDPDKPCKGTFYCTNYLIQLILVS